MKVKARYDIEDLSYVEMNILRYGAFQLCLGYAKSLFDMGINLGQIITYTKKTPQGKLFKCLSLELRDYYNDKHRELVDRIVSEYELWEDKQ